MLLGHIQETGTTNVSHYEIYVEDLRDRNNVIPSFIIRDQNKSKS